MYKVENYPQIREHYFLTSRDVGASRKLRGKVGVISCFMKRSPADFPEQTRTQYYEALNKAFRWLEEEAKKRGVFLQLQSYQYEIDIPANADPRTGYRLIREHMKRETADAAQAYLEKTMGFDEMPFLLVFDESARSFAVMKTTAYPQQINEISAIFRKESSYRWRTIVHELLHQFGAVDLYFPQQVRKCAERYFVDSIMGIGDDGIDDLTAYLIGWKDTISAHTYHFLKETAWLNAKNYLKAIDEAWKAAYEP